MHDDKMKRVIFRFPEAKKGIIDFDGTVEAPDEPKAVEKLNDYLGDLKKMFFRPPLHIGDSSDPSVVGQECIRRLRAIHEPAAFILTLHLFTEHWLNQILLKFCPHKDLTDYTYARKMEICFALGKLTEDLFFNLRQLNKLRNQMAHDVDFDLTKMSLDYRGCHPDFSLKDYKPSYDYADGPNHISNVLVGVMDVTYMLLHTHCLVELGFTRSAALAEAAQHRG